MKLKTKIRGRGRTSLFVDDTIIYVESLNESTTINFSQLLARSQDIREILKTVFLYTSRKQVKNNFI